MTPVLFLREQSCHSTHCRPPCGGRRLRKCCMTLFSVPGFQFMGCISMWTYFELMDISSVFSNYAVVSQGCAFPDLKRIPNSVWNSICVPRAASWSHLNTLRCARLCLASSFYLTWLKASAWGLTSHLQAFSVVFCTARVNKQIMCMLHRFCLNEYSNDDVSVTVP